MSRGHWVNQCIISKYIDDDGVIMMMMMMMMMIDERMDFILVVQNPFSKLAVLISYKIFLTENNETKNKEGTITWLALATMSEYYYVSCSLTTTYQPRLVMAQIRWRVKQVV